MHTVKYCGKTRSQRKTGPRQISKNKTDSRRLRTILNPALEDATARLNTAHKEFVKMFEMETREMINNTEEGQNISCPECSAEIHRLSFNFHRKSSCPNKNKKLKTTGFDIRDFL